MSERFFIDCNGIFDNWRKPYGDCRDRLTWGELCDTLNELDEIADDKLENYEYVTKLEKENLWLKKKLMAITERTMKIEEYINDIKIMSDLNEKEEKKTKREPPKPNKRLRHVEIFGDKSKGFDLNEKEKEG